MEGVDLWDDSQDDSCVQFHPLMGMFVPDSIGVSGVEDDVAAVAEVEGDAVPEAGVEDDVGAVAVASDAICEMDVIVPDTYESEDDVVFEEIAAVPKEEIATRVTVLEVEEVLCSLVSEVKVDLDFDLNKLPIRGMFRIATADPLYEENFIQMLRILLPDFY